MRLRYLSFSIRHGFTLVEFVVVIVVLGVVSAYAAMRGMHADDFTLPSQAQKLASDIRHAQTLAYTMGKRMRVTVTAGRNGSYGVSCVSGSCAQAYTVTLARDVALNCTNFQATTCTNDTLDLNSKGQPTASKSFTLDSQNGRKTVSVGVLTGDVTVTP